MYKRVVPCGMTGCRRRAGYKIAAPWDHGGPGELKTYDLACTEHLRPLFFAAEQRHRDFPTTPGEAVEAIGIYRYEYGKADRDLVRLDGLEKTFTREPHSRSPRKAATPTVKAAAD